MSQTIQRMSSVVRSVRIIALLVLVSAVAQAARIPDGVVGPSPWRFRIDMGAAMPTGSQRDVLSTGFVVGLGGGYELNDRVGVGLHGRINIHDYDERDGVPLGPGYYEPSWNRLAYGAFAEYRLATGLTRPYLALHGGLQNEQLMYSVDRPGEDEDRTDTSTAVGMLAGALGIGWGSDDVTGDMRLELRYETRPGHWNDATWSLTLGFNLGKADS